MYRIFVLCFVLLICALSTGCGDLNPTYGQEEKKRQAELRAERESYDQKCRRLEGLLTSPRKLRKMRVSGVEVTESQASFAHFIFVGRINGQSRRFEDYDVVFAWEREPSEYIISRLPMKMIKFQLHPEKREAEIQFSFDVHGWWSGYGHCNDDINKCLNGDLLWATLNISEKDWPTEVSLPLNSDSDSAETDKRRPQ